ncbi:hypothetical protein [Pseudoxanthomonas winnipegensis]|uniref:Uncharacterized protein n=1 Tax=Pseudoxanthomonas winnipegensis TaxID=2480810 RepID=A0A4Q8M556_9GAMM|nr:hypothetical protein [Pseudoxanthomonas winnipegensis]TAA41529.1 hypothetical protein EA655_11345 [Pseudoxanthomonas winnipegensis]
MKENEIDERALQLRIEEDMNFDDDEAADLDAAVQKTFDRAKKVQSGAKAAGAGFLKGLGKAKDIAAQKASEAKERMEQARAEKAKAKEQAARSEIKERATKPTQSAVKPVEPVMQLEDPMLDFQSAEEFKPNVLGVGSNKKIYFGGALIAAIALGFGIYIYMRDPTPVVAPAPVIAKPAEPVAEIKPAQVVAPVQKPVQEPVIEEKTVPVVETPKAPEPKPVVVEPKPTLKPVVAKSAPSKKSDVQKPVQKPKPAPQKQEKDTWQDKAMSDLEKWGEGVN